MVPRVVYQLHGKPIRFEIVLMESKISDRKSHSDYALPFRVTDRMLLKGCLHLHGKHIRLELNREEPGTGEKNKKDVNGTKFTG